MKNVIKQKFELPADDAGFYGKIGAEAAIRIGLSGADSRVVAVYSNNF